MGRVFFRPWPVLAAGVLFATLLWPGDAFADGARLSVVFDRDNLPYSRAGEGPEGLDVEIARLVARQLGADLDIRWVNTEAVGLLSSVVAQDDPVDMAVGVPVEPRTLEGERPVGRDVLFSLPYASARYALVTRKDHRDVAQFLSVKAEQVGVESGSVASRVLGDRGFLLQGMASQDRLLAALAGGRIDCAVLWNNAGWMIAGDDEWRAALKVQAAVPDMAEMGWDLSVAVGKNNGLLLARINEAMEALRNTGVFRSLFAKYRIPYFEPCMPEKTLEP